MTTGEDARVRGRVLRSVGGIYDVAVEPGREVVECSLRGRLKRESEIGRVAVGDEVEIEEPSAGDCVITGVLPRSSRLSRRSADGRREQIIAANVEQLAAVFAVVRPEPSTALIDRFLVLAESSEIPGFLVINKIDLSSARAARKEFSGYEEIGYEVLYTSSKKGRGMTELRDRLASHITLFVGPSGVGKSSLLNALQPGLGLRVGELSRTVERGRHTTVTASLHPLDAGGYVVDTPGLGQLQFWEVGRHELAWCFPEFRAHTAVCKFGDCTHTNEPECGVISAVERGEIPAWRYESYQRILEEQRSQNG